MGGMTSSRPPHPAQRPAPLVDKGADDLTRLGTYLVGDGIDVVVLATRADAVDLCLVDVAADGTRTERRYGLRGPIRGRWHGHIPGVQAGQRYGLRVHGPWRPDLGMRHNPAKFLLDPYARALDGYVKLGPSLYPHEVDEDREPISMDPSTLDSLNDVALGIILPEASNAGRPPSPANPIEKAVIYEAHVKGFTKLHPEVPEEERGTYKGMGHPAVIKHLQDLGVTTLELLPLHATLSEPFLEGLGLHNYWGYSTLSYFAPEPSYATVAAQEAGPQAVVDEVKGMVDALHAGGIRVLLDVVYNHSAEGGDNGPSLSLRGLDSTGYYLYDPEEPGKFLDVTGCGNSLDFRRTHVVQLMLDSLRYWVAEIGMDGFRFDLAVTLGRNGTEFTTHHPSFVAMATDPILRRATMIAEPWDLGHAGWRTGQFPTTFQEWNDRFRDAVRNFWLRDPAANSEGRPGHDLRDLATRLSGSGDLFGHGELPGGRGPTASINFVTAHDGFTMADLVSYNHKHNEANLEGNRDGSDNNRSWNHGVEGEVAPGREGADILERRRRSIRNMLGTLAVAAGIPMLTAGDEFGRTQRGNNNAYAQDNEISWVDWGHAQWQHDLTATTSHLLRLRRKNGTLRPGRLASGAVAPGDDIPDLSWADVHGKPLPVGKWHDPSQRVLQMMRSGLPYDSPDLLVVLNGYITDRNVTLMPGRGPKWQLMWDSALNAPSEDQPLHEAKSTHRMMSLSMRIYFSAP